MESNFDLTLSLLTFDSFRRTKVDFTLIHQWMHILIKWIIVYVRMCDNTLIFSSLENINRNLYYGRINVDSHLSFLEAVFYCVYMYDFLAKLIIYLIFIIESFWKSDDPIMFSIYNTTELKTFKMCIFWLVKMFSIKLEHSLDECRICYPESMCQDSTLRVQAKSNLLKLYS